MKAVADAVLWACHMELEALKPGNVGRHGGGHGMELDDFLASAACVAPILGQPGLSIGERIRDSITATRRAVGCNTNLGIVLLCAPLAHAALTRRDDGSLRNAVAVALGTLDRNDTACVFEAIRLAEPAGLGSSPHHDVHDPPQAGLLEVMREAAGRDRIAYQYAHEFADVFELGMLALEEARERFSATEWAAVAVYLTFLGSFNDTHVCRKNGPTIAEQVRAQAQSLLSRLGEIEEPQTLVPALLEFDDVLKERGINPGTSADLTVATLLAGRLQELRKQKVQ